MNIRERVVRYSWAQHSLQRLKEELDRFRLFGNQVPTEPGGWWHQYVCPTHHGELLFDPMECDAHTFRCPEGCLLEGEPYRGAWLVFKHQSLARYMLQAAAVYAATGQREYADLSKEILRAVASQFPRYPVHPDAQPWMLRGRAFHQALTEAIWATTLLRGYSLLLNEEVPFEPEEEQAIEMFFSLLEASMKQYRNVLIYDKGNPENNYTAWLNAALGCLYAVQGDKTGMLQLIQGEGGFVHHLGIGVKADQLEFEGSLYYHVFVLRAYLILAESAHSMGIDLYETEGTDGQSLRGMLDVMSALADDDGLLPALHDGPYRREPYAREIAEVAEIGFARYGSSAYLPLLAEAYSEMNGEPARFGLEALLYGCGEPDLSIARYPADRASVLLPQSGFAVLRRPGNRLSALTDFGPHGGSHGHYDKLHISLAHRTWGSIAPDKGMVPYGSSLRKDWYAETAAHNTVTIGGASQQACSGTCAGFEINEEYVSVEMYADDAYPNARLSRSLVMTDDWLLDVVDVEQEDPKQVTWRLHLHPSISIAWPGNGTTGVPGSRSAQAEERTNRSLKEGEAVGFHGQVERIEDAGFLSKEAGCYVLQLIPEMESGQRHDRVAAQNVKSAALVESAQSTVTRKLEPEAVGGTTIPIHPLSDQTGDEEIFVTILAETGSEISPVSSHGTADRPTEFGQGVAHTQTGRRVRFVTVYSEEPVRLVRLDRKTCGEAEVGVTGLLIVRNGQGRSVVWTEDGIAVGSLSEFAQNISDNGTGDA